MTNSDERHLMAAQLEDIIISPLAKAEEVLHILQHSKHGVCIVTNDRKKILGTITDGDCRRAFLRAGSLNLLAQDIMNPEFIVVDESFSRDQIFALMRANNVQQIPIVNSEKQVIDLISASMADKTGLRFRDCPVLILAGGEGQRMRPLTNTTPKPMLPIAGRPILERILTGLVSCGYTNIIISINYLGDLIEKYFGDGSKWNCNIQYIKEEQTLGTAGPLRLLDPRPNTPIMMLNGDLVTSVDFGALLDFHVANNFDFSLGISRFRYQVPYGVITTNEKGVVTGIEEKPICHYAISAGIYVLQPELIELIPQGLFFQMNELIDRIIVEKRSLGAFPIHEAWWDVGAPDQYFKAQAETYRPE